MGSKGTPKKPEMTTTSAHEFMSFPRAASRFVRQTHFLDGSGWGTAGRFSRCGAEQRPGPRAGRSPEAAADAEAGDGLLQVLLHGKWPFLGLVTSHVPFKSTN